MRAFVVEEKYALDSYYIHNGLWEIIARQQLDNGTWLIECKGKL